MSSWTRSEDKLFEQLIVMYPETEPDRWEKIASCMEFKSAEEVKEHYGKLLDDISMIDAGLIELPNYEDYEELTGDQGSWDFESKRKYGKNVSERKKGTPWTEDEHKSFLLGLQEFGKGDWKSIARRYVMTRTPTQVASHAQKYFLRQSSVKKERKRSSIHDITTVDELQQQQNHLVCEDAPFGYQNFGLNQ